MPVPIDGENEREVVPLELENPEQFLRRVTDRIAWRRAITANFVAIMLGVAVIVALPLHIWATWLAGVTPDAMAAVFDQWYALVSPLAGAALGAYYASDRVEVRKDH